MESSTPDAGEQGQEGAGAGGAYARAELDDIPTNDGKLTPEHYPAPEDNSGAEGGSFRHFVFRDRTQFEDAVRRAE